MSQDPAKAIKTMKLYTHVERVERELKANGQASGPLQPADLVAMDQLHYGGTQAVDEAIEQLSIHANDHVLDVGAGLGGPARHMAHQAGCAVTAVELQPDLNALGQTLTDRCGLSAQITHHCGDILDTDLPKKRFDAMVSWLTVLHIPHRQRLFERCHRALKTKGRVLIEDFYAPKPLDASTQQTLKQEVACGYLPSLEDYKNQLQQAGFESIELKDMSVEWTDFVTKRLSDYRRLAPGFIERHGQGTFDALDGFYGTIVDLFKGGLIGGLRIQAVAAPLSGKA
ncbi:MAG TPA: methyltransferase domain-containing protein [Wenzhouxiangella sp.]